MHRERAAGPRRVLPSGTIGGERLGLIDARATLRAGQVRGAGHLALRDLDLTLTLENALLRVDPLKLGVADGTLDAALSLDGHAQPTRGEIRARLQGARLATLVPKVRDTVAASGRLGGTVTLSGQGDSVAALLGRSQGEIQFATRGGQLSNLLVEAIGLDAAEVLKFLAIGDRPTPLRCAVGLFDVRTGVARTRAMVIDTGDTRIDGEGRIDLGQERLDLTFRPRPPRPAAAPLAALLPLIDAGQGEDAPCSALVARAHEAGERGTAAAGSGP